MIWSRNGRAREIVGPSIQRMFYSTIRFLDRHTALPGEYLVITYKSGTIEHLVGPASVYQNPIRHASIEVQRAIQLSAETDCIIVVGKTTVEGKESAVYTRRIVTGPAQFIPSVDEAVQPKKWTSFAKELAMEGQEPSDAASPVISTAPFSMPVRVGLATSDGFTFTMRLRLILRVRDVARASSCDPIGSVWEALRTDIAAAGAQFSSTTTISLDQLGQSGGLPSTSAATKASGLELLDVAVKEVLRPEQIVRAEEKAIAAKARHDAEMEHAKLSAELDQHKAAARLTCADQNKRVVEAEFDAEAQRARLQFDLEASEQKRRLELEAELRAVKLESAREENQVLVDFLGKLKSFDVDLTKYLMRRSKDGSKKWP